MAYIKTITKQCNSQEEIEKELQLTKDGLWNDETYIDHTVTEGPTYQGLRYALQIKIRVE
jgi:hypothetical protein